jgi:AcrR family transcriptional regulator
MSTTATTPNCEIAQPPLRADARRNRDRLIAAAREAFAERGAEASLDDIARRAGVGPGTLYRHFPTRFALMEAVYRDGVEALCAEAHDLLSSPSPGDALATWLRSFLAYVGTKRGLGTALKAMAGEETPPVFAASHEMIDAAGTALLARAKEAGAVRPDVQLWDLFKLVSGIAITCEQAPDCELMADRLLALVLNGVRTQPAATA